MGRPRRYPDARRRTVQGEEQGGPIPRPLARGAGPHRRRSDGARRGDQTADAGACGRSRTDHGRCGCRPGGLHGQEPQFRPLFPHGRGRRAETLHRHGRQDEPDDRRLGAQGIARRAARRPAATPAARNVRSVRRQRPLVEHLRPVARELPQLRAAVGPLRQSAAVVRRAEHDAPLGDQIHPLGIHRPQRRAVHLREGRQPLRTLHDRRVSGHLRQGVGELPAPAAKRHVAERGDLGADRGRHQAVDLPLAWRRLENPPLAGAGAARPGQHRGGDTQGELPQPARRGGVQQRDHRPRGRDRQPGAERDARRSGRKGRHRPRGGGRTARHPARRLPRTRADSPPPERPGRATSRSRPSPSSRPSWSASARCWTRDSGRATS